MDMKFWAWLYLLPLSIIANPQGAEVVQGDCSVQGGAHRLEVIQSSDKAIVKWDNFSINKGEITKFIQPSSTSAILNRVTGDSPSQIYGTLKSNGKVYLINQAGVFIGPTGVINSHTFITSALDVADAEFLDGKEMRFLGESKASVVNAGRIQSNGDILLIAKEVINEGELIC